MSSTRKPPPSCGALPGTAPVPDRDSDAVLPFDIAERLLALERGLAAILEDAGAAPSAGLGSRTPLSVRLLDVGGAPGLLARHLERLRPAWRVAVIDVYICFTERYVLGSGLALPFADGAVDVAYCSDVLEHIPKPDRRRFLCELARVSRRGVVVAAPFRHPNVDRAESLIDGLHSDLRGGVHPWLTEHRTNGLPDLQETLDALREGLASSSPSPSPSCSSPVSSPPADEAIRHRLVPNADLERWFLLRIAEILCQILPGALEVWNEFQGALDSHWNDPDAPIASVPYRWVVSVWRGASSESPPTADTFPLADFPSDARLNERFAALAELARGLGTAWGAFCRADAGEGTAGTSPNAPSPVHLALIERLEAVVRYQETLLGHQGKRQGRDEPRSRLARILERLLGGRTTR